MRVLILLLLLVLSPIAASAQVPGVTPEAAPTSEGSDASLDELIRIIENEETRAALIERLKRADAEADVPADAPPDLSIVRQLAEYTRAAAEGTSATLRALGQVFTDLQQGFRGAFNADFEAFRDVAIGVLLVAAGLVGSFLALRIVVLWAQRAIARRVAGRGWLPRILGALGSALVDLGSVLLAWAIGYVVALLVGGWGSTNPCCSTLSCWSNSANWPSAQSWRHASRQCG